MKIGEYTFLHMEGAVGSFGDVMEDETRPGLDGHTFRKLGKRGNHFDLTTKQTFTNINNAKRAVDDYNKLQCTFQVLEDQVGNAYRKVIVHSVQTKITPIGAATNGHTYMVEARWNLQRAG
jgi:hypothetical protein